MIQLGSAPQVGARFVIGASWLGAAAASLCFAINVLWIDDRAALWTQNALDPTQRRIFVVSLIVSAVLPAVVGSVATRLRSFSAVADNLWLWGHRTSPLVLLAPIVPLYDRDAFLGSPITALSYMLVIGLLAAAIGTRALEHGFPTRRARPTQTEGSHRFAWVAGGLTMTVCVVLFAHFAHLSLLRHHQMQSDAYDLGIFDNVMWHLTHGEWFRSTPAFGPEGNHLHRHTTFGAILFVPIYALSPRAETLLVLQAAFAASTPVPVYLLGRRLLGSPWLGLVFALGYALYAPTHGPVFYDFHFLTLASPLLAWVFYLSFTDNTRALVLMTFLTLAWREDTGAVLAFAGVVLWLWGIHPKRTLAFVAVCAAHFVLTKFVFMPLGDSHASYAGYYSHLRAPGVPGFWSVIETMLTNPFYVFDEIFRRARLQYVLLLFVPLLFFPLRSKSTWIALIPAALFTLFASRPPLYQIYFQYTVFWAPTSFLLMFMVLRRRFVETDRRGALAANAGAVLLTTVLTSYFFGSVFESPTMRGGFRPVSYEWTEEDRERLDAFRELAARIPADASVAASSRELTHLSNRRDAYAIWMGHFDADYILVRRTDVTRKGEARDGYREALATGRYEPVAKKNDFVLYERIDDGEVAN